jgi:hypothetical protein
LPLFLFGREVLDDAIANMLENVQLFRERERAPFISRMMRLAILR